MPNLALGPMKPNGSDWVEAGGQFQGATGPALFGRQGGGRRRTLKAKTLKKLLKKAGLKTSGKKSTLRARAKKAHLVRGGVQAGLEQIEGAEEAAPVTGGRRRHRRSRSRSRSSSR
jgi:hypothetical protein